MFQRRKRRNEKFDYDKKENEEKYKENRRRWRRCCCCIYDEKEKLIQSHHLNIKTFPQTPLNCVSIFKFLRVVHLNIRVCTQKKRHHRRLVSVENVAFFVYLKWVFLWILLSSLWICATTKTHQQKYIYINVSYIYFNSKKIYPFSQHTLFPHSFTA